MSSSSNGSLVKFVRGNLLDSNAHTLINTVNCVGVMGKGIALEFKKRYPGMYHDYKRRCDQGRVKLGQPYAFEADDHLIINFPTKDHWRSVSRLEDIEAGLEFVRSNLAKWRVRSLAVPPLGCGNGQLEWSVVGPTLYRHLVRFGVPVELYVPHDVEPSEVQLSLFDTGASVDGFAPLTETPKVDPALIALVEALSRIEREPYHWPIGRIMFQKLAYFATAAGLPTGLQYEAGSFGPYAADVKRIVGRLQNNGLVTEQQNGRAFEVRVGPTYVDARSSVAADLDRWSGIIARVVDLFSRFDSNRAEIAASVHFATDVLRRRFDRVPAAAEVTQFVLEWKSGRKPAIRQDDVENAIVLLATQRWIHVEFDQSVKAAVRRLVGV